MNIRIIEAKNLKTLEAKTNDALNEEFTRARGITVVSSELMQDQKTGDYVSYIIYTK